MATIASNVAETINAGEVTHREYPANSMAHIDACSLLSQDDFAALPGGPLEQTGGSSQYGCSWGTPSDIEAISVGFTTQLGAGVPIPEEGDEETTIGGWKTFIWEDGEGVPDGTGPTRCVAMAVANEWPDELVNVQGSVPPAQEGEQTVVELPTLTVRGPLPHDQLCDVVRSLAEKAWQGIPT